jgi:hypothetical protein
MDDSLIHSKMTMMVDDLATWPHVSLKTTARISYSNSVSLETCPGFAPGACSLYGVEGGGRGSHV